MNAHISEFWRDPGGVRVRVIEAADDRLGHHVVKSLGSSRQEGRVSKAASQAPDSILFWHRPLIALMVYSVHNCEMGVSIHYWGAKRFGCSLGAALVCLGSVDGLVRFSLDLGWDFERYLYRLRQF